jgi:PPOX class probable F420-dependent enzyme
MDIDQARDFIRENHRAVLATRRSDARPQLSPVTVAVDDAGRILVSSRETAYKVKNLRRDPYAAVCALNDQFFGPWCQVEGPVEIVPLPEAMELLVDYYRRVRGEEHPDWDEYRAAMESEQRVMLRMTIERAGPTVSG